MKSVLLTNAHNGRKSILMELATSVHHTQEFNQMEEIARNQFVPVMKSLMLVEFAESAQDSTDQFSQKEKPASKMTVQLAIDLQSPEHVKPAQQEPLSHQIEDSVLPMCKLDNQLIESRMSNSSVSHLLIDSSIKEIEMIISRLLLDAREFQVEQL